MRLRIAPAAMRTTTGLTLGAAVEQALAVPESDDGRRAPQGPRNRGITGRANPDERTGDGGGQRNILLERREALPSNPPAARCMILASDDRRTIFS